MRPRGLCCAVSRLASSDGQLIIPVCSGAQIGAQLATADNPKLSAALLDEQIAHHVEQARRYTAMAAELPAQAAAYNAAAAYLQPIKRSIDTAMLYAGI